jgi:sialic acid synthase SpsE
MTLRIGHRTIGPGHPAYIIAEVGSNHGGNLGTAFELIDACAAAGADAVKFQSWTSLMLHNSMDVAADGTLSPSKVVPILDRYELPVEWHRKLFERCRERNVDFLSTPFDADRARLLRDVGVPAIKISSSDVTFDELLTEVGGYGIPVLLSTGMADLAEISHALVLLGRNRKDIVLLQCTAAYPPAVEDANLRAIGTLAHEYGLPVGISDHYPGRDTVVAAVALGACVIEKHVTLSRRAGTPDAFFAIEMDELKSLVDGVRAVETALGDGKKRCMTSERGGLVGGRRGVFAARDLAAGDVIERNMLAIVRPNVTELQPGDVRKLIGARLARDVPAGAPLQRADVAG